MLKRLEVGRGTEPEVLPSSNPPCLIRLSLEYSLPVVLQSCEIRLVYLSAFIRSSSTGLIIGALGRDLRAAAIGLLAGIGPR